MCWRARRRISLMSETNLSMFIRPCDRRGDAPRVSSFRRTVVERLSFFRQLPTNNLPVLARVDRSEGLIAAWAPGSPEHDSSNLRQRVGNRHREEAVRVAEILCKSE